MRWNFLHKAAGTLDFAASPKTSLVGVYQIEPLAGAGNANIGETPLLVHILTVAAVDAALVGQNAIFHTYHKDDRIFQSFGGMQRHQRHGACTFFNAIGVADQRDFFQELRQSALSWL